MIIISVQCLRGIVINVIMVVAVKFDAFNAINALKYLFVVYNNLSLYLKVNIII